MHYQVIHHTPGRLRVRCGRGMFNHDQACGIECRLLKLKGVSSVKATPCNGGVFILYEGANPQTIFRVLDRLRPETLRSHEPEERAEARKLGQSFSLKIAGKVSSFLLCKLFLPPPLRMAKAFWNYGSYFRRGMAGLGSGRLNVAVLDAVSIGVSIGTRAYGTANSIMFLLSISDLLENYTRKKTRAALAASLSINVDQVWRVEKDGMRQVPMEQIRPGDKIRVDAGNVIPVDGAVLSGEAEVNQAAMTGESEAAAKQEGSVVFAGTTLETGSLVIRVDAMGDQSRINNIIALIDHSEELKARIQSRAEKLADSIVPLTLLTAGALFLFTRNISKALSVLMVDYSCAIKLATPISVISAMKEASARKIMIKGGKFMELFARADTIVFDKTGTLTSACPQVTQIVPLSDCSREYILKTAACLEEHFPHSVARAVVRKALEEVRDNYDVIFIDCPPSLEMLTLNGLIAADGIMIPVQCEYYALEGLSDLMATLRSVKRKLNQTLDIFGVVLTMFDGRTNFSTQVAQEVRRHFPGKVFTTVIPRNVRLAEAPSHGLPVTAYDRSSRGAVAYRELAQEVAAKLKR